MIDTNLNKLSDACWRLEDDPLVHGDGLLVFVHLYAYIASKKQQRIWRHLCTVIQEDLKDKTSE